MSSAEWVYLGADDEGEIWVLMHGSRALVIDGAEARVWAAFEQFVTVFEVRDRLPEIPVPTLIVASRNDPVIPIAHCERLHAGLPQATLIVLEESTHDVDQTTADGQRLREAVRDFLAGFRTESATSSQPARP